MTVSKSGDTKNILRNRNLEHIACAIFVISIWLCSVTNIVAASMKLAPQATNTQHPLTLSQVEDLIDNRTPDAAIASEITQRGINFKPEQRILEELRRKGAKNMAIRALQSAKQLKRENDPLTPDDPMSPLIKDEDLKDEIKVFRKHWSEMARKDCSGNPLVVDSIKIGLKNYFLEMYQGAEEAFKRAGETCNNDDKILTYLGLISYQQGKYDEAEKYFQSSLEILGSKVNKEHSAVAICLNSLAELYEVQGKLSKAEENYKSALEIRRKVLGPNRAETFISLCNLIAYYVNQQRRADAEPLHKEFLSIIEKLDGTRYSVSAEPHALLGRIFYQNNRYNEAELLFRRFLDIRKIALGPESSSVTQIRNTLGQVCQAQNKYEIARWYYTSAIKIIENKFSKNHISLAPVLDNLASLQYQQQYYEEAESDYRRALNIRRKYLPEGNSEIIKNLNDLAYVNVQLKRTKDVWELYDEVVPYVASLDTNDKIKLSLTCAWLQRNYEGMATELKCK